MKALENPSKACIYSKAYYYRNREKRLAARKARADQDPDWRPNRDLLRFYGITLDDKRKMLALQQNKCAICTDRFEQISQARVDHDHKTGKIRGLLCNSCNVLLGNAKDDLQILASASSYLASRSER